MNFIKTIVAAGLVAASTSAFAADITGAGSTFVYPVLSKWSADYNKQTGDKLNYQSIGSGGGISPRSRLQRSTSAHPKRRRSRSWPGSA